MDSLDEYERDQLIEKLEHLQSEHTDLNEIIQRLYETPPVNELQLQRLKKRKLMLKDQISCIEAMLVPDILA